MKWFFTADFLKIFLPVVVTVFAWALNERSKRKHEEYVRKEERYTELVKSLRGFQCNQRLDDRSSRQEKQTFLDQLNLCWLYCPDGVIERGYAFLKTVKTGAASKDEDREKAVGEFVLAVRRDLFGHRWFRGTELKAEDFEILKVN